MAGRIRQSDVEEVKARANIADVIGEYVTLKSAGVGSLKGLCPFHEERSPSFNVRPQVGYFHCFGCGESGDVFTFLRKIDHLTFAESVENVARRVGVVLQYEDGQPAADHGNRARLIAATEDAALWFAEQLHEPEAEPGRRFLGERGFDAAAAADFGVGFAPKRWDGLAGHLRGKGYSDRELVTAGLVASGDRGVYDRFRGRLVWPIRDITGTAIGFGARRLLQDDQGPKYLNTPETPIYRKASVLYGLDKAKRQVSREHRVVVVEGYTDVMACHLAGVGTAVATCGTAFGVDHIKVLRRVLGDDSAAGEVVFTFDPDAAGQKAAVRAFAEERRFAAQTYVAVAPDGLDPCDLRLQRGDAAVQALMDAKRPMFEFMIRQVLDRYDLESVEGRVAALRQAAPIVAEIRDPSVRPGYARSLARSLGMDLDEVRQAVSAAGRGERPVNARSAVEPQEGPDDSRPRIDLGDLPADPLTRLERDTLMAVIQFPGLIPDDLRQRTLAVPLRNGSLGLVRDAIAASSAAAGSPVWVDRIVEEAPEEVRGLVRQLAVAPVPERSEAEMGAYVRGIAVSLIDRDLTRVKADLLGRLQRTPPSAEGAYRELNRALVRVEEERRRLRGD